MAKRLRYHPLVADDISAAIDWYEGRSAGLGERFRSVVDARFDDIVDAPEMFPRAFDDSDFQFARIPKFPYLVLFREAVQRGHPALKPLVRLSKTCIVTAGWFLSSRGRPAACLDLIDGLVRMMEQEDGFVGPVNLGNPDEFSIRELAEQVIELCGSDSTLVQEPLPEDDPVRRRPDITLARQKLGVAAARPAARGPRKDIDWFRRIDLSHYRPPTPNY